MTTVYWTPMPLNFTHHPAIPPSNESYILMDDPKPLLKEVVDRHKGREFIGCPATQTYLKNTFVISAPISGTASIVPTIEGGITMQVQGFGWSQDFHDNFCYVREDGTMTYPPRYLFYAHESVEMELLPVFLLDSPSLNNALVIPGSYDIGRWVRPVDFTFMQKDVSKPTIINRGDPLFFVRFKPKNDEKVVLERVECTEELLTLMRACTGVKFRVKNLSLPELYKMSKSYLDLFFKGKR